MQAQWEMRVVTQKLQSLTEGGGASGDLGAQLDDCRDDSASLRLQSCFASACTNAAFTAALAKVYLELLSVLVRTAYNTQLDDSNPRLWMHIHQWHLLSERHSSVCLLLVSAIAVLVSCRLRCHLQLECLCMCMG